MVLRTSLTNAEFDKNELSIDLSKHLCISQPTLAEASFTCSCHYVKQSRGLLYSATTGPAMTAASRLTVRYGFFWSYRGYGCFQLTEDGGLGVFQQISNPRTRRYIQP